MYNYICFSTLLYLKFLLLWAMVILADFILEFRFEFLWPFWLLLRSVYDSFKYQGLVSIGVMQLQIIVRYITSLKSILRVNILMHCFFFPGLLCVFYLYCTYIRHDLLFLHPCALAILCCQHLCLGAICLAHRYAEKQMYYMCIYVYICTCVCLFVKI